MSKLTLIRGISNGFLLKKSIFNIQNFNINKILIINRTLRTCPGLFNKNEDINKSNQEENATSNTNDYEQLDYLSPKLKKYIEDEKVYNGKLVYVGALTSQLKTAKAISLSSSMLGIFLLPFLSDTLSASGLFAQLFVYGTTGFFIFVTPLFSLFLGKRYVSRLYYNYEEKKFKAIQVNFFLAEHKTEFSLDDAFVPDLPGVFSTVQLKSNKKSLFIDLNQITDVDLVQKIYGYDKPLDLKKYQ